MWTLVKKILRYSSLFEIKSPKQNDDFYKSSSQYFFGSVRSSRSHKMCLSVRPVQVFLELSIFIFQDWIFILFSLEDQGSLTYFNPLRTPTLLAQSAASCITARCTTAPPLCRVSPPTSHQCGPSPGITSALTSSSPPPQR